MWQGGEPVPSATRSVGTIGNVFRTTGVVSILLFILVFEVSQLDMDVLIERSAEGGEPHQHASDEAPTFPHSTTDSKLTQMLSSKLRALVSRTTSPVSVPDPDPPSPPPLKSKNKSKKKKKAKARQEPKIEKAKEQEDEEEQEEAAAKERDWTTKRTFNAIRPAGSIVREDPYQPTAPSDTPTPFVKSKKNKERRRKEKRIAAQPEELYTFTQIGAVSSGGVVQCSPHVRPIPGSWDSGMRQWTPQQCQLEGMLEPCPDCRHMQVKCPNQAKLCNEFQELGYWQTTPSMLTHEWVQRLAEKRIWFVGDSQTFWLAWYFANMIPRCQTKRYFKAQAEDGVYQFLKIPYREKAKMGLRPAWNEGPVLTDYKGVIQHHMFSYGGSGQCQTCTAFETRCDSGTAVEYIPMLHTRDILVTDPRGFRTTQENVFLRYAAHFGAPQALVMSTGLLDLQKMAANKTLGPKEFMHMWRTNLHSLLAMAAHQAPNARKIWITISSVLDEIKEERRLIDKARVKVGKGPSHDTWTDGDMERDGYVKHSDLSQDGVSDEMVIKLNRAADEIAAQEGFSVINAYALSKGAVPLYSDKVHLHLGRNSYYRTLAQIVTTQFGW